MKITLIAVFFALFPVYAYCEIPQWQIDAYKRDKEIQKAEAVLANSDSMLKTAVQAQEYVLKKFGDPSLVVVMALVAEEELKENEWNLQKGDVVWWTINKGWVDNGIQKLLLISAKDGTILQEPKSEPAGAGQPM